MIVAGPASAYRDSAHGAGRAAMQHLVRANAAPYRRLVVRQVRLFFSEEKNQKTYTIPPLPSYPAMAGKHPRRAEAKVFCFFSSEKKIFLTSTPANVTENTPHTHPSASRSHW
jgi:hypothetical protein